jgi:hypothetical protein
MAAAALGFLDIWAEMGDLGTGFWKRPIRLE